MCLFAVLKSVFRITFMSSVLTFLPNIILPRLLWFCLFSPESSPTSREKYSVKLAEICEVFKTVKITHEA